MLGFLDHTQRKERNAFGKSGCSAGLMLFDENNEERTEFGHLIFGAEKR